MKLEFMPGLHPDWTGVSEPPRWKTGSNVRFRQGRPETMGILRNLRDPGGTAIGIDVSFGRPNFVKTCVQGSRAQVLVGTLNRMYVLEPSVDSTLSTGTRWVANDITPAGLATITDNIGPDLGRVNPSKAWWATVLGNTIVMGRGGNLDEPAFIWDRNRLHVATAIAGCPHRAVGGCISPNNHLILFGCEDQFLGFTGLTVRWANQQTTADWAASVTSTAGAFELSGGSRIISGGWSGFDGVAWTDTDFWQITELNDTQFIFRPKRLSTEAGLIAQGMWCESAGALWWLGQDMVLRRYRGGTPEPIPCTVGRETFDLTSRESVYRGFLHSIGSHGEIWCWCSTGAAQLPDRAAVYSEREQCWTIARYPRAAMCDRVGPLRQLAVDENGLVYEHECSIIDDTPSWGNDAALSRSWSLRSALIVPPLQNPEMESAEAMRLIVDMARTSIPGDEDGPITVTLTGYDWYRRNLERKTEDITAMDIDTDRLDFRLGCKSYDLSMAATDLSETRFGQFLALVRKAESER